MDLTNDSVRLMWGPLNTGITVQVSLCCSVHKEYNETFQCTVFCEYFAIPLTIKLVLVRSLTDHNNKLDVIHRIDNSQTQNI